MDIDATSTKRIEVLCPFLPTVIILEFSGEKRYGHDPTMLTPWKLGAILKFNLSQEQVTRFSRHQVSYWAQPKKITTR